MIHASLIRRFFTPNAKKGLVINTGVAAVSMFAATAIAAKAMMPDANLVQTGMSAAAIGVSLIPLGIAGGRVANQLGNTGRRVFDALHKSPVGKVLGKVSAGTLGGVILGGAAMSYLGSSHMEIAGNLFNPLVWKYAAIPVLSVLGMATVQRGLKDAKKREDARVGAAYTKASTPTARTRVNPTGMETPSVDPIAPRAPGARAP